MLKSANQRRDMFVVSLCVRMQAGSTAAAINRRRLIQSKFGSLRCLLPSLQKESEIQCFLQSCAELTPTRAATSACLYATHDQTSYIRGHAANEGLYSPCHLTRFVCCFLTHLIDEDITLYIFRTIACIYSVHAEETCRGACSLVHHSIKTMSSLDPLTTVKPHE
jgi:hypothetical protein